jgi:hypothetical protein
MSLEQDDSVFLTDDDILERIDEYALYCHYLGFEPQYGVRYPSPIRDKDDHPSFVLFVPKRIPGKEFYWRDTARGISGDFFDLLVHMLELPHITTRFAAVEQVAIDFGLVPGQRSQKTLIERRPKPPSPMDIRIKSRPFSARDLNYWEKILVTPSISEYYNTTAVSMYWMYKDQPAPRFPRTPMFAYRIWDKYKLYAPFEPKDFKFRNNFDDRHLEGFLQLKYNSELLIIAKAMKEVQFFRALGIEAVAPRGEWTLIPQNFIDLFKTRYRYIATFFDNDGKHKGPEYVDEYQIPSIQLPVSCGQKDPTDYANSYGTSAAEDAVLSLIYEQFGIGNFTRSYLQG